MCSPPTGQAPSHDPSHSLSVYPVLAEDSTRPVRPLAIRSIQEKRLREFVGGQFSEFNLTSVLFRDRIDTEDHVRIERWSPPAGTKPSFEEAVSQVYEPCRKGTKFGPSWSNHWLRLTVRVPREWIDLDGVELEFDAGCEALLFNEEGLPLQGFTGGPEFDRRIDFPLTKDMRDKTVFYIEVTANGMFGIHCKDTRYYDLGVGKDPDANRFFELSSADIVVKRTEAWGLLWDFVTLQQCVEELPKDSVLQNRALWVTNEIINTFRRSDVSSIERCRELAREIYGKDWSTRSADLYHEDQAPKDDLIWSLGHCHIDSAWLWPFSATQQKVARSWATQIALMERYPEYCFTASSAQQYKWLETLYPKLFTKLLSMVEAGRFQPIGALWVECDANMPSGESFVRQLLYGQRYFESRFGKRSDIFWLPDTFGYNAQIPQLARQAGCQYFFTQKLCWNNVNRFPHNTMMWVGLDGTQIIMHQTPVNNYNSRCGVNDLLKGVKNNMDLQVQPTALHLFGFGDGGGGANPEHLERLRRARAISNNGFREIPKVTVGRSAREFFDHVLEITEKGERLATWSGEVYLEFHRGVYTSQASIKRWNRYSESVIHDLEWLSTIAAIRDPSYEYPQEELHGIWEPLMLNQFHDCLPGSSIRMVYNDMEEIYTEMNEKALNLYDRAFGALAALNSDVEAAQGCAFALNSLGIPRRELVEIDTKGLNEEETRSVSALAVQQSPGKNALLLLEDMEGIGRLSSSKSSPTLSNCRYAVTARHEGDRSFVMEGHDLLLRIQSGRIVSILDKLSVRELVSPGRSAGLSISEDYPPEFDNWEVEVYSLDTVEQLEFSEIVVEESGPWRAKLCATMAFGKSKLRASISIDSIPPIPQLRDGGKPRTSINFDVEVDWQEKHRFLRFEIPTSIRSEDATFETQFGVTRRPTGRNTTWDAAKFEVCGHRFADLSEPNYGLSLVTQSKYGYSVEGSLMRLSLLKAGTYPDSRQDEGHHGMSFTLYPHMGGFEEGDVVSVARVINSKPAMSSRLRMVALEAEIVASPFRIIPDPNLKFCGVVLDTLKMAEDEKPRSETSLSETRRRRTVICRMYESIGSRSRVKLSISVPVAAVSLANILEDELAGDDKRLSLDRQDGKISVPLEFRPFEVKTLRIVVN